MFLKKERKRKRGVGAHRILLSLVMLALLAFGTYQAYKSFSGVDPLTVDPKSLLRSALENSNPPGFVDKILSFNPNQIIPLSRQPAPSQTPVAEQQALAVNTTPPIATPKPTPKPQLLFKFAVVADSENDNDDLLKALDQAKGNGAQFVVGLGDWSQVGTIDELNNCKKQFDTAGLKYYLIPGDHDQWDSRNRGLPPMTDYIQVFGKDYSSFNYQGTHFLLVNNSDNYSGVDSQQMSFIENDLSSNQSSKLIMAFLSTPIYHPSSDHIMGDITPSLKKQAGQLDSLFASDHVKEVFGGDTHFYSEYTDPTTNIDMTAVGAITAYRNIEAPRYVMVDVFNDGSYNIQDTEVQ